MRQLILCTVVMLVAVLLQAPSTEASITFTYGGTFDIPGADHAGIKGADFTFTAVFPESPYIDNGAGLPVLTATSTTFTITGAPLSGSNGEYIADRPFVMLPTLGGQSEPVKFVHEITGWTTGPRLIANLDDLFGGDGSGATIGSTPSVSHFPTATLDTQMVALPHNILYDVTNPSITTVPEPSTLALLCMGAFGFLTYGRRRNG